jgi:hypothetical protein
MAQPSDTGMFVTVMRRTLEPTTKLAQMLGGCRASLHEILLRNSDMPYGGLFSHGSRETSGVQVDEPGGTLYATPTVSR